LSEIDWSSLEKLGEQELDEHARVPIVVTRGFDGHHRKPGKGLAAVWRPVRKARPSKRLVNPRRRGSFVIYNDLQPGTI
jgi:hypothetical protein